MTEASSHLDTTADAYDAVAVLYDELARNSLDALPLDRAFLAAFAEFQRVVARDAGFRGSRARESASAAAIC